jgi:exportin-1
MIAQLQRWAEIIGQARQSVEFLKAQEVVRAVLNILQVWMAFAL